MSVAKAFEPHRRVEPYHQLPRIVRVGAGSLTATHVDGAPRHDTREQYFAGIVQAWAEGALHTSTMNFDPLGVYLWSVATLLVKYLVTISVQARERLRARAFRYPEDAACWRGNVGSDSDLCQRAERLLRNDAESQPFFLVFGLTFALQQPPAVMAAVYFLGYAATRVAHGFWLLGPRQPHRNRAFALGLVLLFCMAGHALWNACHAG